VENRRISVEEKAFLLGRGWESSVGAAEGIWVSAAGQEVLLIRDFQVVHCYRCSTARNGMGSVTGSQCTPEGWHEITEKSGADLPPGAVLKSRQWTGDVWSPGSDIQGDAILSRVLRLSGLEQGVNLGGEVDTFDRMIYIHGTNAPEMLGRPASHGCVRLSSEDVIDLFERVETGCRVLITAIACQ